MVEKSFIASDGIEIFYDVYECNNPKAIIQIIHGSIEHSRRYSEFAEFLVKNGFTVYAIDLRGHGRSINKKINYLSDQDNGWDLYIEEVKELSNIIKGEYPDEPLFIMGHSMGSFIVRDYISKYNLVDGVILSGTGSTSTFMMKLAMQIIKREKKKYGKDAYSEKIHKLIYGSLDNKAKKLNVSSFVSSDESVIKKYNEDPLCGETITIDYANEMAKGIIYIGSNECFDNTIDVPIYIFSGENDPVGGNKCHLVKRIYNRYKSLGLDVTLKIYEGGLHEMLNEINKDEVYNDIINWIGKKL